MMADVSCVNNGEVYVEVQFDKALDEVRHRKFDYKICIERGLMQIIS